MWAEDWWVEVALEAGGFNWWIDYELLTGFQNNYISLAVFGSAVLGIEVCNNDVRCFGFWQREYWRRHLAMWLDFRMIPCSGMRHLSSKLGFFSLETALSQSILEVQSPLDGNKVPVPPLPISKISPVRNSELNFQGKDCWGLLKQWPGCFLCC